MSQKTTPPQAKKIDHTHEEHGQKRHDPYFWLRDRENPEVIAHLKAENAYTDAILAPIKPLRKKLFEELKSRIKEVDLSVPVRERGYLYNHRFEEGKEYPVHVRRKGDASAPEEVILDENERAGKHEFYELACLDISDDNKFALFAEDFVGRRRYTLRIKEIATGRILDDAIEDMAGDAVWSADGSHVFYVRKDQETLRAFRVFRHEVGASAASDVLVFEEKDEAFNVDVTRSKSGNYVFLISGSTLSTECRYLDASRPTGEFRIAQPREKDHLYFIDHLGGDFFFLTNWKAKNFRVMKAPVTNAARDAWTDVVPHQPKTLLRHVELFNDFMVLQQRTGGVDGIRVIPWTDPSAAHDIDFGEDQAYMAHIGANREIESRVLRFGFTSLISPDSVFDYDMGTRKRTLLKQREVVGGFDANLYASERRWVKARDGIDVPISIVYRKDRKTSGGNPLLLYGYGSYGNAIPPYFSSARLSLLDRGFVFAIAHIRGGDDLGRSWYEDGRQMQKKNTFWDFIDCGEFLAREGYADRKRLFAMGGSAGGLLMGAVINMRPDLFKAAVAQVPFVDVITTMLDPTIPLTTGEYDEWGNPNDRAFYEYILSYSPYDNIEKKAYPALLVTTGLHDSQVQYWEPAKWVAKLREYKTDSNPVLLWTDLEAGHGGKSGRYKELEDVALEYAFLLEQAGIPS